MDHLHGPCAHCAALSARVAELEEILIELQERTERNRRTTETALRRIDAAASDAAEELRAEFGALVRGDVRRFPNPNAHAHYLCDLLAEQLQREEKGGGA